MGIISSLFRKKKTAAAAGEAPDTRKSEVPQVQAEAPSSRRDFTQLLTSQLAAFWLDAGDPAYRDEYLRRMRICGLEDKAAENMLQYETDILKEHPRPEMLDEQFIRKPLFSLIAPALEKPVEYYETHFEYPFSYVVKLSDEAEWHYWNSHEKNLPDQVWAEIFALSDRNRRLFLPFATDLLNRGWDYPNVNKFSYNEQGMLDRYRWGRSFSRAAQEPWK